MKRLLDALNASHEAPTVPNKGARVYMGRIGGDLEGLIVEESEPGSLRLLGGGTEVRAGVIIEIQPRIVRMSGSNPINGWEEQ